ncbi:MAG: hypothetical protein OXH73_20740 [Caldilineaceae bacterium]|nr:hypothetical protein [Caldilineaceae bacterium]
MQQSKSKAGSLCAHHSVELENSRKTRLHFFIRGVGSVAVLMPGATPTMARSKVGSLAETGNRIAKTWSRAFVSAKA